MSAERIETFVRGELKAQAAPVARVVAAGERAPIRPCTANDLKPVLEGIEEIINEFQSLRDRCNAKFPDAEADGTPDPTLQYLRDQIRKWHIVWDGWNMPIE